MFRPYEKELFRKNGTRVPVIVGGAVTEDKEAIVFALDLTEVKKPPTRIRAVGSNCRVGRRCDSFVIVGGHYSELEIRARNACLVTPRVK